MALVAPGADDAGAPDAPLRGRRCSRIRCDCRAAGGRCHAAHLRRKPPRGLRRAGHGCLRQCRQPRRHRRAGDAARPRRCRHLHRIPYRRDQHRRRRTDHPGRDRRHGHVDGLRRRAAGAAGAHGDRRRGDRRRRCSVRSIRSSRCLRRSCSGGCSPAAATCSAQSKCPPRWWWH